MTKQDKVNFIKEWYAFRDNMCKKYNDICTECPLYESSDGWRGDNMNIFIIVNMILKMALRKRLLD